MMSKLFMWLTFIASCNGVYILQLVSRAYLSYSKIDQNIYPSVLCRLHTVWNEDKWLFIVLFVFIIFSALWNKQWTHIKYNTRIKFRPETDGMLEAVLGTVPYLVMIITLNLDVFGVLVTLVIMFAFGLAIVETGHIYMCLNFLLHGYHIYACGKVRIITKSSMEKYILMLDQEPNGIEARELAKNIYIC